MVSITIGRSTDSMINPYIIPELGDSKVSRLHAVIELREDGRSFIIDKSANGTSINGIKIPENIPVAVYPGDIVQCSNSVNFDWYRAYQTVRQIQKQKRDQKKAPEQPIISSVAETPKATIAPSVIEKVIESPKIDAPIPIESKEKEQAKIFDEPIAKREKKTSVDIPAKTTTNNFADQANEFKEKFPPLKELKGEKKKISNSGETTEPKKNKLIAAGYLCALYSFIFPVLGGVPALIISTILYKRGDTKDASYQIVLVILLVSLGLFTGLSDIMLIMNR